MSKRLLKGCGRAVLFSFISIFLLFCLLCLISDIPNSPGALIKYLSIGWLNFLGRNIPQLTWNWGMIVTSIFFSTLVILLGNRLLRGLFAQIQTHSHANQPVSNWPWRWTIGLYFAMWLLFLVAFGATGVYRHTAWLMAYREPWVRSGHQTYTELQSAAKQTQALVAKVGVDANTLRKAVQGLKSSTAPGTLFTDQYDVIFCGPGNVVEAYLIIPRRKQSARLGQFCMARPNVDFHIMQLKELPEIIAELEKE